MAQQADERSLWSIFSNRWVKLVLAVGCLVLLGWVAHRLRGVLVPFGIAVVAAYILNPLVEFLQAKLRWPRVLVVVVLMVVATVAVLGAVGLAVYYTVTKVEAMLPAAREALEASARPEGLWGKFQTALEDVPHELRVVAEQAIEDLPTTIRQNVKEISLTTLRGIGTVVRTLLGIVLSIFNFVLFFIVTGYLLIDLPKLKRGVKELLPRRYKANILWIAREIDIDIRAFFRGQFLVAACVGVLYSAGLMLVGVDFAVVIGLAAGVANIVPYMGIVVGLVPALIFACVPFVGLVKPLATWLVFVTVQSIDGYFLTPKVIGRNVGLHPVVVILSLLVFANLFGVLGFLFAIPMAAATKVLVGEVLRYYKRLQEPEPADEEPGDAPPA